MLTPEEKVKVIESYKFTDGRIVAFLKSPNGRLPIDTLLVDDCGTQWIAKPFFHTYSIEGYEIKEREEAQNIFEYLLKGVNHGDKPVVDSTLNISK